MTTLGRRVSSTILTPTMLGILGMLTACGTSDPVAPDGEEPDGPVAVVLTEVAGGFDRPVAFASPPGDERLFVVEKTGRIRILQDGAPLPAPFLDLSSAVSSAGERGLLGLVFHPSYADNGLFFVNYTDLGGDTRIVRYRVGAAPDVADAAATLVMSIQQPFSNHNGGHLLFGPDGMLYIAVGDGGSAGDPQGNGQNLATRLGSILRIDVDAGEPFAVPPDNPFVGDASALPEIWLRGVRNPWRLAFDRASGDLYVADVGQNRREEITVITPAEAGANLGWNIMEGSLCFVDAECVPDGLTLPDVEYGHDEGCSITGGLVYRGSIAEIRGHYFYSDYCNGWLRSFRFAGGEATELVEWDVPRVGNVASFGEDDDGELYLLTESSVYRLDRRPPDS